MTEINLTHLLGKPLGMLAPEIVASWEAGTLTVEEGRHEARQRKEVNQQEHARRQALVAGLATRRPQRAKAKQAQAASTAAPPASMKLTTPRDIQDARAFLKKRHDALWTPGALAAKDQSLSIKTLAGQFGEQYSFDPVKAAVAHGVKVDLNPDEEERYRNRDAMAAYFPRAKRIAVYDDQCSHGVRVALVAHELAHHLLGHEPCEHGRFLDAGQERMSWIFAESFLNL